MYLYYGKPYPQINNQFILTTDRAIRNTVSELKNKHLSLISRYYLQLFVKRIAKLKPVKIQQK